MEGVWRDLVPCKAFKNVRADGPPHFGKLSMAPRPLQTSPMRPSKSGQTAFKYTGDNVLRSVLQIKKRFVSWHLTTALSMCNEAKTWATFGFTGNMGSIAGSSGDVAGGGGGDKDIDKALVRCQDTNRF